MTETGTQYPPAPPAVPRHDLTCRWYPRSPAASAASRRF